MPTPFSFCLDAATCLDALVAGGRAPSELRLFKVGPNPSVKGTFLWDEKAADAVMRKYRAMGRGITWDYDHAALRKDSTQPDQTAKSAGICDLELRNGELWCVRIRWVKAAKDAIEAGEWPFYSPAFNTEIDKEGNKRPTWLISIALTGNPALHDLSELTEAASALYESMLVAEPDAATLAASDSAPPDTAAADRLEAARKSAAAWASQNLGVYGPAGTPPEHPAAKAPLTFVYPSVNAAGWLGAVEPADGGTWIAFVRPDGRTALWDTRAPDGSVQGSPTLFQRDLAGLMAAGSEAAEQPKGGPKTGSDAAESPAAASLAMLGSADYDEDLGAELRALQAAHAAFTKATEALDYNPNQPRDKDGQFDGHGGGGGMKTGPATPVGGGHKTKGGDSTTDMTPVGHGGGHANPYAGKGGGGGSHGGGGGGSGGSKGTHAEHDKREHEEQKKQLAETARRTADSTGQRANTWSERAKASPTYQNHERAQSANRIASGAHKIAADTNPEHAAAHKAAAARHDKAADHHEREMIRARPHGPYTAESVMASVMALAIDQRRALGQWSYGRELSAGHGGLAPAVSRRADLASHSAHASRMADAHRDAAKTNRDVAGEHEALAERHTALAAAHPDYASTHREEAKAHAAAAKRHMARAEAHEARAAALEAQQPGTVSEPDAALSVGPTVAECDAVAQARGTAGAWAVHAAMGVATHATEWLSHATEWAAVTQPLTGTYPDPAAVGGWIGWVEDEARTWIAFVATDGMTLLWERRAANGAVAGDPVLLWREVSRLAPTSTPTPAAAPPTPQPNINPNPQPAEPAALLSTVQPSAGVAEPADTTENKIMHKALNDYSKAKGLDPKALKARLTAALKGNPFAEKCDAALSDDESKQPTAEEMKGILKALKTLDYAEDEDSEDDDEVDDPKALRAKAKALRASTKALKAKLSAAPPAAKGDSLSVAALSALGVAVGLAADAQPDTVMREALSSVSTTRELCSALGVKSADALVGKIEALKTDAEEGRAAVAKLSAYEAEKIHDAATLSITTAEKENRLTPAKKAKAEGFLAAKKYEALNAFLDACEPVAAMGAGPTQFTAEQLSALNAAGTLPKPEPAAAGGAGSVDPDVAAMFKDPDFLSAAKGLGLSDNRVAMLSLATDMVADKRKRAALG